MKFCTNCKLTYDDSANVCAQCGTPLIDIPNAAPAAAADPSDHTAEFDPRDISDNKVFAVCPYLFSVLGIIVALLAAGSSPFTMFHVRQSIKLTVFTIIFCLAAVIPIIGWIAVGVWSVIAFVIEIICIVRIFQGKAIETPIVKNIGFLK